MNTLELRPKPQGWALVALIAGAVGIGFSPIFVRLSEVGPFATAYYRLFLAFPFLALGARTAPAEVGEGVRFHPSPPWMLATSGLFFAGDLAVWHWSIHWTSVANATLLANFAPIFVVLGNWLLWRQPVTRSFIGAVGIVVSGTVLLLGTNVTLNLQQIWGNALGLLTALFYASYLLSVAHLRLRFSTLTISLSTSLVGAFLLLILTVISGESLWAPTLQGWLVLLGLALISQAIGHSLITYALAHLPATFSSVSLLVEPIVAALVAWGLFNEALSPTQSLGGGIILVGIGLAHRSSSTIGMQNAIEKP